MDRMSYYEKLVRHIEKSMNAHPRSTVVMDASTFKILATGRDTKKLARKLRRSKTDQRVSVVFQKPDAGEVWILNQLSL
jgi:hypothetical protein